MIFRYYRLTLTSYNTGIAKHTITVLCKAFALSNNLGAWEND